VNRWGLVALAAVIATAAGGCGGSSVVQGSPVPATDGVTTQNSTAAHPTPAASAPAGPAPIDDSSVPSSSSPQTTASTSPVTPDGPAAVVQAYFDAINARDYQRAWTLGGKNIGQSYATFTSGFAATDHDVLTIQSTQGNTVTADLTAIQTDGTQRTFHGTYTVTAGTITGFSVRPST
jgi:hypothetical protein